jgi:hypothetical protein
MDLSSILTLLNTYNIYAQDFPMISFLIFFYTFFFDGVCNLFELYIFPSCECILRLFLSADFFIGIDDYCSKCSDIFGGG